MRESESEVERGWKFHEFNARVMSNVCNGV